MRIQSITYNNNKTSNIQFKQKTNIPQYVLQYNNAFNELRNINLMTWSKRSIITGYFDDLINTVQNSDIFQKTEGFQRLYSTYKANGLRGMLYTLGQYNSETLQKITKTNSPYTDEIQLASTSNHKKYISIKTQGPFGFFNSLFNRKTQNEVLIKFTNNDPEYAYLRFSLDKKGNYRVKYYNSDFENTILYYANKDGIKDVEAPKVDLYLPPGLY